MFTSAIFELLTTKCNFLHRKSAPLLKNNSGHLSWDYQVYAAESWGIKHLDLFNGAPQRHIFAFFPSIGSNVKKISINDAIYGATCTVRVKLSYAFRVLFPRYIFIEIFITNLIWWNCIQAIVVQSSRSYNFRFKGHSRLNKITKTKE